MKKIKLLALALLLATTLSACEVKSNEAEVAKNIDNTNKVAEKQKPAEVVMPNLFDSITAEQIALVAKKDGEIKLIDLRTPEEVKKGKLAKEALEIDFSADNFNDELNKLDKTKTYLIYSKNGEESAVAKDTMKKLGFTNVYDLKGGLDSWKYDLYVKYDRDKVIAKYLGKPSVFIIAGTFCPHCQAAMPKFETDVWDVYKDDANIFVNVTDGGVFPQERISQGTKKELSYDLLTGEECGYVPSFVILDKEGKVALKSCGAEKTIDDIKNTLETLI